MAKLSKEQQSKQELYRDARFTNKYDDIWQSVGKCVFCDLNEKYVFFEENGIVMTISLYAYIDGHFMIVPRRHVRSIKELTELEWQTIRKFTYIAKKLIKSVHNIKGMQLIQKDGANAQSTVEHIHFHCVPFDSADLLTWNYRKLKNTPLENVALYKEARKKILTTDVRFQKKYRNTSTFKVVCDLIVVSSDNKILFQERSTDFKLNPDYITLPGGSIESEAQNLENELAREVQEEIGYTLDTTKISLVSSRIDSVTRKVNSKHLNASYPQEDTFVRNTYLLKDFDSATILTPADDAAAIIWVDINEVGSHPRISASTKQIIKAAKR